MNTHTPLVKASAELVFASRRAYAKKWVFAVIFSLVLLVTTSIAGAFDVLPNPLVTVVAPSASPIVSKIALTKKNLIAGPSLRTAPEAQVTEEPLKIEVPRLKIVETVNNPKSTDVKVLDDALLSGVVRYPTSAQLGENGNVIIFGHSSHLPLVNNKEFKAFNDIETLKAGDTIVVTSKTRTYTYAVDTVVKANASQDEIPLGATGNLLTLATCNSFGTKSGRFIVTAHLVESNLLGT
jgi:LPXTG-site transpeptidase (sortase) family protein